MLVDGRDSPDEFERLVVSLIQAGVHAIQLRDKRLDDRELLARARLLRALTWETPVLCIVNDRPDLAALARADGVHVGQEEVSVKDARRIVGPESLVGVSTHSIEQARQAVLDGANYIGVGPAFPPTQSLSPLPRPRLASRRRLRDSPAGLCDRRDHRGESRRRSPTGVPRIAVTAAITAAPNPAEAARRSSPVWRNKVLHISAAKGHIKETTALVSVP